MSSAYIMVNHEARKFSIWQANTGLQTPDIVAVDRQNNMISEFCTNSKDDSFTTSLPTPSVTPSVTPSATPPQQKLSSGAIGGIVGGAVGGIAVLGAIGFCLYRRRRPGAPTGMAQEPESQTDMKLPTYDMVPAKPQELPVYQYNVSELDSRAVDSSRH